MGVSCGRYGEQATSLKTTREKMLYFTDISGARNLGFKSRGLEGITIPLGCFQNELIVPESKDNRSDSVSARRQTAGISQHKNEGRKPSKVGKTRPDNNPEAWGKGK